MYSKVCPTCGNILTKSQEQHGNKYCSLSCAVKENNKIRRVKVELKSCLNCDKEIELKPGMRTRDYNKKKFCNKSCSVSYNNTKRVKNKNKCKNCGDVINHINQYCSVKCQAEETYLNYIVRWKQGLESGKGGEYGISKHIRRYMFEKHNNKCSKCGWGEINEKTKRIPLEVEHIDGNYLNNDESNLDLLCPNCHSLTYTYKGSNKGKGRKGRHKYDKVS